MKSTSNEPREPIAPGGIGRLLLLIAVVLAVPIVPFLVLGEAFEARIDHWLGEALAPGVVAASVIGLLAADIFLPVPSSAVSALAGHVLGFWKGTAASWCGMTLGAAVAFGLARLLGRPLARRLSSEEDLQRMDRLAARFGVLVVVLARPVPVFAEASVLLMGTTRLAWWRFLAAAGLSNLGISAAYAALGDRASLPIALAASLALPLVAAAVARVCWPRGQVRK
jgi:uncharacterized membrane protein YdjX (TVP38/TMEM64 family)